MRTAFNVSEGLKSVCVREEEVGNKGWLEDWLLVRLGAFERL